MAVHITDRRQADGYFVAGRVRQKPHGAPPCILRGLKHFIGRHVGFWHDIKLSSVLYNF